MWDVRFFVGREGGGIIFHNMRNDRIKRNNVLISVKKCRIKRNNVLIKPNNDRIIFMNMKNPRRTRTLHRGRAIHYLSFTRINLIEFKTTSKVDPTSARTAIHNVSQPGMINSSASTFNAKAKPMFCLMIVSVR